jgi:heme oxygenase
MQDIFERLKTATSDLHKRTEQQVPVFDPTFDLVRYIRLLERFHGFWMPLEARLLQAEELGHPALAIQTRMKSHLLEADLRFFRCHSHAVPLCADLPAIDTFLAGLGCLYVLEGSTLGARIISRRIESHLGVRKDSGGSFFSAYGETAGRRWAEFHSFVTAHVSALQADEIVTAAVRTFESLLAWLSPNENSAKCPQAPRAMFPAVGSSRE